MKPSLSLFVALAFAGSVQAADLIQVYRDARSFDAQYAAARAARDAGLEKLPQGRAGLLPTIGLSANTTRNDSKSRLQATGITSSSNYNSNGWSVSLSQPIFNWQNWVGYKQGELAAASAEAQLAQAGQELIVRVAEAYFDVLLAQETLATAQAQKVSTAQQLESAKRNFEVGTATITDTHEAQARYDLIVAQEIAAANDLAVKRHALRTLTGKEPENLKTLKTELKIDRPQPDDIARWVESAEGGNIGVQLAQTTYEIANREIQRQRAGHYPTLSLEATHVKSNNISDVRDEKGSTIGLKLAVPIYAGGAVSSRDREAVALAEKARADLDNARRQAALAARQAYLGVSAGLAQVKALEAGVASSQLAVESNKLGYEVGVRINIDVLNAQSQLFDTRQKLAKARLDTLIAQLRLKSAAGSLTEDDLATINALLE
jgi:outer membrane protein